MRNVALTIEKYQIIINYKFNRPVKIREAGFIFWFGASPDGVIFNKKNSRNQLIRDQMLSQ